MNTKALKTFAQNARRQLHEQVAAKLTRVLAADSYARRAHPDAVAALEARIAHTSRDAVVEQVAYTWFNRFIALRYMDVNRYTFMGIVSPAPGFTQPELLQEAKQGLIPDELRPLLGQEKAARVLDLLAGRIAAPDPQAEAYRLLLVAACNFYHGPMPFMFEEIDDYTELLMPDDLLSPNSILQQVRDALDEDACQDVEVIGWLYQFYISEKKDQVIGSKQKIRPEDIPAATQLFTPHWIVRYLVENSLGRLWMLNHPRSRLQERMDYYIPPETPETDFLRVDSPEELRVLDPAAGSGHMLTYAFDLLYAIYEEEGYAPADIPRLILEKNLVGLEIDARAAALAAFALTMKAREKDRRFFRRKVAPDIAWLHPVDIDARELGAAPWLKDLRTNLIDLPLFDALKRDLEELARVDVIGSLLRPQMTLAQIQDLQARIQARSDLFSAHLDRGVLDALAQLARLAARYHVVVANPPYMGGRNMPAALKKFLGDQYTDYKSDLFAAFIIRNLEFALPKGQLGFMTPFVWMFISSYEKLRYFLIDHKTITSLIQLEYSGFEGATVPICTFTLENAHRPHYRGGYVRLSDFRGAANQAPKALEAIQTSDCGWFYRASAADFKKIPGGPIAYWLSQRIIDSFASSKSLGAMVAVRGGMTTADNELFVRFWYEPMLNKTVFPELASRFVQVAKWYPYNKGGDHRKWYGNRYWIVDWENDGKNIKRTGRATIRSEELFFTEMIGWTDITSYSQLGVRYYGRGFLFDASGPAVFPNDKLGAAEILGFLGSKVASLILQALNSTFHVQAGNVRALPWVIKNYDFGTSSTSWDMIDLSKIDWDSYETSWDFTDLPLLRPEHRRETLAATYAALRQHWREMTLEMKRLEEENNRIFIEAYGLEEELSPDVPIEEITLTCNPHYRYGGKAAVNSKQLSAISERWPVVTKAWPEGDEGLEMRLLADTMREFISYAVGCMFGRYSLDRPGLILANQGEGVEEYVRKVVGEKLSVNSNQLSVSGQRDDDPLMTDYRSLITFMPDANNVIPILAEDWFPDDITERFKKFLRVTFGEAHYEENLAFIEAALGKDIRRYFLKDFYADHVKRYKKRPIYWLFSSPKGHFNALIYMHRYRPDTLSVILNDYLREFKAKLQSEIDHLQGLAAAANTPKAEKTRALKRVERLKKMLADADAYERDILFPLATQKIEIDLDDGVKVNYNKFGRALKKVTGLSK